MIRNSAMTSLSPFLIWVDEAPVLVSRKCCLATCHDALDAVCVTLSRLMRGLRFFPATHHSARRTITKTSRPIPRVLFATRLFVTTNTA